MTSRGCFVSTMSPGCDLDLAAPFDRFRETIVADWVDYNRHMNAAFYAVVFDRATEAFLGHVGAGQQYARSGTGTVFALEAIIRYEREVRVHDVVRITTRLVDRNARLVHLLHSMHLDATEERAATMELLLLHVDPATRRGSPWPEAVAGRFERLFVAHRVLAGQSDAALKIRIRA